VKEKLRKKIGVVYSKRLWWRKQRLHFPQYERVLWKKFTHKLHKGKKKTINFLQKNIWNNEGLSINLHLYFSSSFCENSQLIPFVLLYFIWCFHENHFIIKNTDHPKMFSSHEKGVRSCWFQTSTTVQQRVAIIHLWSVSYLNPCETTNSLVPTKQRRV